MSNVVTLQKSFYSMELFQRQYFNLQRCFFCLTSYPANSGGILEKYSIQKGMLVKSEIWQKQYRVF